MLPFASQLAKIDSRLQRGLDNAFALIFGGKVVPAEIEELLKQQTQDNIVVTEDDRVLAPNLFLIGVSSKDLENLSQQQDLPEHFKDRLTRFIRNSGWGVVSGVVVRIAEESGLRTGQLRVSSDFVSDPGFSSGFDAIDYGEAPASPQSFESPSASNPPAFPEENTVSPYPATSGYPQQPHDPFNPPSPAAPAVSLLLQDGSSRIYHVREGSNIIGRSNEADFRLPDTGVSREHAEITWDGQDAVLVDLQSTNGTTVNGNPIDNWLLDNGDIITMGHSRIEVHINQSKRG